MAGGMVLLVAHQGHITLDLLSELFQESHLPAQVLIVIPEKPFVVPVFSQLVADRFG